MTFRHHSCIRLVNAVFYAWHGVNKEEHRLGGKYEVDAELFFDGRQAAEEDNIGKTVDYLQVYEKIRLILTEKRYALIEAAAFDIASGIMADIPLVDKVSIRVRKRNPPIGGICDYAEAEYVVERA